MVRVRLIFNNFLNVSAQAETGDIAYFANTLPVPSQPTGWTHHIALAPGGAELPPPHETSPQEGIIKIGEIVDIIDYDGLTSSLICDMPQDLFNKYANDLIEMGVCEYEVISNRCQGKTHYPSFNDMMEAAFLNPTVRFEDIGSYARPYVISQGTTGMGDGVYDYNIFEPGQCYDYVKQTGGVVQTSKWGNPDENFRGDRAKVVIDHFIDSHGWNIPRNATYAEFIAYQQQNIAMGIGGEAGLHNHLGGGGYACACKRRKRCPEGKGSFIMFSKNNKVNQLEVLGYYAAVEYRNNSTTEAELFNVGTSYFGSSK